MYPYLLKGLAIECPDQVWCADITYIPMARGYLYLVAILDWYSRYVLEWELSNSLESSFCLEALDRALRTGRPDIFNTDQGRQFTSADFTGRLQSAQVQISMDGRGRAMDNIFVERFWWSLKYEEVYLRDYEDALEARQRIGQYIVMYNTDRPHQSLDNRNPEDVHRCRK